MKRIGVISDTHIPRAALDLPERVYKEFRGADMILHAGDLIEMSVFEKLRKIAPTHAVSGNMDTYEVKEALPQKETINVEGFKIGLMHGYGPPAKIIDTVSKEFNGMDVIVFGHSHSAFCERIKNTLFFNPGSPTDKIFAAYNSFGILEIGKEIKGRIIRL
ncbi:MAG: metallophosphoesterase family protein [Candidatus Omnitrophota bacterium]|nr:MAG: metallophosphoesterase family protein [Candidatus Omnitrophota bacterium]